MSLRSGSTSVFRIPSAEPAVQECTSVSCEIAGAATEPGAVVAAVVAGLAAFVAFAYICGAKADCRRERARVLDEREAFSRFGDRVSALDPAPASATSQSFDGTVAGVRAVDAPGDDVTLRRVLAAYRDTVMSLPHYRSEYDETLSESLAAELGPDTATALASNGTLSPAAQSALVRRSRRAAEARESLADAIQTEIDALTAAEGELGGIDRRRRRLVEHLDGIDRGSAGAAIDVWQRLDELESECDAVAADRQAALDDPPMTPNDATDIDDDRAFYEYLYGPTDGPRFPVLSEIAELAAQIRSDKKRVAGRLADGR